MPPPNGSTEHGRSTRNGAIRSQSNITTLSNTDPIKHLPEPAEVLSDSTILSPTPVISVTKSETINDDGKLSLI
jgi:hypothetical protein